MFDCDDGCDSASRAEAAGEFHVPRLTGVYKIVKYFVYDSLIENAFISESLQI